MSKAPYIFKGDEFRNHRQTVEFAAPEAQHQEAAIAISLVEKWGMVAAMPDGEDSVGRAKLRLATVDEVIKRACDAADQLMAEIRKRGWTTDLPSPYTEEKEREA